MIKPTPMKTRIQFFFIVGWLSAILLGSAGCERSGNEQSLPPEAMLEKQVAMDMGEVTMTRMAAPGGGEPMVADREVDKQRIIRDGRMGLKVNDLEAARLRVDSLVSAYDAYYANERYHDTDRESSYNLSIRVPAESFEALSNALEAGSGQVLYREVNARDVTEQFIDMETRLASMRIYLERYRELLGRAQSVQEILEVENRIRQLQEEIDSTVGRLRYLQDQVDYSTLELMLTREKEFRFEPGDRDRFGEQLKQALHRGWDGTVAAVLFLFRIWPIWLLAAIAAILLWKRRKKLPNR
jgi:hypothetical protein